MTSGNPYLFTSQRRSDMEKNRRPIIPADHGTKRERMARERLLKDFHVLDSEDRFLDYIKARVPDAWRTLERDVDVTEKKVLVTLRVDESVAKFYRAMGRGHQERMNRVLSAFAQLRISQSQRLAEQIEDARDELRAKRKARVAEARRMVAGSPSGCCMRWGWNTPICPKMRQVTFSTC
jgi:uncharacterized protein (DUF4415 family)